MWNGSSWKLESTPNPTGARDSSLSGVSCTSASACTAVGYGTNSSGTYVTLAETWDGKSWKVQNTANPSGAQGSQLDSVSCTSASACTAVGYDSNTDTLAEAWNGTSWQVQSTPNPAGAKSSQLNGVSCTSASACTAAGAFNNGFIDLTLADRYS